MRLLPKVLLTAFSLLFLTSSSRGDWTTDPGPSGLLVRLGGSPRSVVTDGAGGALVGFGAYFGGSSVGDVVIQKLGSQGMLPWGPNGVAVGYIGSTPQDYGPLLAPDGSGGAVAVWRGPSGVATSYLHGERISSSGVVMWPPSFPGDGVHLATVPPGILLLWVDRDGVGGFIAAWVTGSPFTLFAQRFDANGSPLWGSQGANLGISFLTYLPAFAPDGQGGFFAFWDGENLSGTERDLYAQRFGSNGQPLWNPGGVIVCSAAGEQGAGFPGIAAVSDGQGGACVAWADNRVGDADVYAQRVDGAGTPLWAPSGVPLCTVPGTQGTLAAVSDGTGGIIAAWEDGRAQGFPDGIDLYAQRAGSDGAVRWEVGGAAFVKHPGDQTFETPGIGPCYLSPDGSGGIFAAWSDPRPEASPGNDIYAQHISGAGVRIWPLSGLLFGSMSTSLAHPAVMSDGQGGCAVLWSRGYDLYARGSSGPVTGIGPGPPAELVLHGGRPNPALGNFQVAFTLAAPGATWLEVFDVTGRRVWRRAEDLGPGAHAFDVAGLEAGLYFLRLQQSGRTSTGRTIVLGR